MEKETLIKNYIESLTTFEKSKDDLKTFMKDSKLNRIELPDGSYFRFYERRVDECIALVKKKKVD